MSLQPSQVSPVLARAASFYPVLTKSELKKCEAYFFKG